MNYEKHSYNNEIYLHNFSIHINKFNDKHKIMKNGKPKNKNKKNKELNCTNIYLQSMNVNEIARYFWNSNKQKNVTNKHNGFA